MKRCLPGPLLVLVVLGACSHNPSLTVADSELATLGGKGLEPVEAARKEEEAARRAVEARQAELAAAVREVHVAEQAIKRDEADFAVARLRFEAAQETRDADAMLPANTRRTQAERALAVSEAELPYRQAVRAYCDARVDEAELGQALALAALERAKLAALFGQATLTAAQEERRASFDAQAAKAQAELAAETANVARAKTEMQAAEARWRAAAKEAPARAAGPTASGS